MNIRGVPGGNIPADLHNEHLNRVCKKSIKALGSNKTAEGVIRTSKALRMIAPILRQFDSENNIPVASERHSVASVDRDRDIIVNELTKYKVLEFCQERGLLGQPKPNSLLHKHSKESLQEWVATHLDRYFSL